ncbi:hypothetical protein CRENBAI_019743 [Crenichthys baileyi]|uniref:Histone H2A n=1 Tax=Crenichthys baileyi TaxID=28760 RepID=A0AAV9QQG5_9TELE
MRRASWMSLGMMGTPLGWMGQGWCPQRAPPGKPPWPPGKSHDSRALEAQALEGQLADQQLGGFLVAADLPQSHGTGACKGEGFLTPPVAGALLRAALVASCFLAPDCSAAPPAARLRLENPPPRLNRGCLLEVAPFQKVRSNSPPRPAHKEAFFEPDSSSQGAVFTGCCVKGELCGAVGGRSPPVYLAAVLEYLTAEILELAGKKPPPTTRRPGIIPVTCSWGVRNDEELKKAAGGSHHRPRGACCPTSRRLLLPTRPETRQRAQIELRRSEPKRLF